MDGKAENWPRQEKYEFRVIELARIVYYQINFVKNWRIDRASLQKKYVCVHNIKMYIN